MKKKFFQLCNLMMFVGILTACQSFQIPLLPTPSPALERIFASQIQLQDFPQGWYQRKPFGLILDVQEAVGRGIVFVTSDRDALWNVSQNIYIYETLDAAASSFDYWVTQAIPPQGADSWFTPPELVFNGQADQIKVACLPSVVNSMSLDACAAITRYGDTIMILRGTVDDHWLTMTDFYKLLEAADKRIVAARGGAGQ